MDRKQLVRIAALLLFFVFLYLIRNVLFPIVFSVILYYILKPLVNLLSKRRPQGLGMWRSLAILIAFVVFIVMVGTFFYFVLPPFQKEFNLLMQSIPQFINQASSLTDNLQKWYSKAQLPDRFKDIVFKMAENIFNYIVVFAEASITSMISIFTQFIQLIIIPIITFYLLYDDKNMAKGLTKLIPPDHQEKFISIFSQLDNVLENYVRGQLLLCSLIGVLTGAGLYFLGIELYLILGAIAAITEMIPMIGPFLGAAPAVIIAFIGSPALGLKVTLLYTVVQLFGNFFLLPKIMGQKLNLHPLTVVISVLILGNLVGIWGLFFAAPITAALKILYLELRKP